MAVGPNIKPGQGPLRIEPPTINDDGSDDGFSDTTGVKPMGVEEFKQIIQNETMQSNEATIKKKKKI